MHRIPTFALIITAAGKSERFNKNRDISVKKEYLKIDGHTVLYRATEPFYEFPSLSAVVVTTPEGSEDETAVALEDLASFNSIPLLITSGGRTRTESVKKALEHLKALPFSFEYIMIHDGARPYITPDEIIRTLASATVAGGAAPARRVTDAVKRLGPDGFITENVDRSDLIRVQTPQVFKADELYSAYEAITDEDSFADDIEVFINAGFKCTVTQGLESNKKITYLEDIEDAEKQIEEYVKARKEGRKSREAVRRMHELMAKGDEE